MAKLSRSSRTARTLIRSMRRCRRVRRMRTGRAGPRGLNRAGRPESPEDIATTPTIRLLRGGWWVVGSSGSRQRGSVEIGWQLRSSLHLSAAHGAGSWPLVRIRPGVK